MPKRTRSRAVGRSTKRARLGRSFRAPIRRYRGLISRTYASRVGRTREAVHWFTRYCEAANNSNNFSITGGKNLYINMPSAQTGIGFGYAPCLSDLVNIAEFSALYDQYKLLRCQFTFRLLNNPNAIESLGTNATTNTANFYPALWLCPDHDDIATPTLATIRQISKAKRFVLRPNSFIRYSIRPTSLTQVYDGVVTTAYSINKPQWLDISRTDTPHYGLKGFIDTEGTAALSDAYLVAVEIKLIFGMKGVR